MRKTARRVRKRRAKLTNFLKEDLDGIEAIQTSNAESRSFRKISKQVNRVEEIELRVQKYSAMITGIAWGLTTTGLAMTWWYGGLQVLVGEMTIGTLVIFSSFVVFVYSPLRRFSEIMSVYNKSIVAVERIQEILDMSSPVKESKDAKTLQVHSGEIKFQNVSFSYDKNTNGMQDDENKSNKSVLHNVSLTIGPKGLTTIVGKSGSGKSSFLRLIPRLYDPQNDGGKIVIDGQDIKEVTLKSLRNEIAVVPQNPMMFSGTIYENVIMGRPDATKEQVENACRAADAYDFIVNLEDGFDTVIGENDVSSKENSVKLSQGQSQRITIARALLREPKILLLDEPTSALDMESEYKLFEMLNHLKDKMTIMAIVHNLQLANIADKIVVVDNGIIDAIGTHSQLVSSPGIYQNLYTKGR
jgi:ABC-type multidrug transport system fused ATPase/permease subunit